MLGNGCTWRSECNAQSRYNQKNYCSSASNWKRCPHRPMNAGNERIEREYNYRKSNSSSINLFWFIVVATTVVWLATKFIV